MRVWNRGFRNDFADREECVEALRDVPWKTLLLCFILRIAGCHVDAESIAYSWSTSCYPIDLVRCMHAFNGIQSALRVTSPQVLNLPPHNQSQFHLIMQIH